MFAICNLLLVVVAVYPRMGLKSFLTPGAFVGTQIITTPSNQQWRTHLPISRVHQAQLLADRKYF